LATSPRNPNFFVDDPGKLYRQRRRATQAKGVETLDSKVEVEGPSKSLRESPPPSPKEDQPQSPERKIKLCTPNIVDLTIINLQDAGRPFKDQEEDGEDGDRERSSTPKGRRSKIHMQGVCGARPCPRTPSLSSRLWRKY
jgi:hypothetical protein